MPLSPLLYAIRQCDAPRVHAILSSMADAKAGEASAAGSSINEEVAVEPSIPLPHELPVYPTTPLLEACRQGQPDIVHALLSFPDIEVNKRTTRLHTTAFGDACARGDIDMARLLLSDGRTDPNAGDEAVAFPALYACITGNVPLLAMFAEHGILADDMEEALLATADAAGHASVRAFVEDYFVDSRPLRALDRESQMKKVRRICQKFEYINSGHIQEEDIVTVFAQLDYELSVDELREVKMVLTSSGRRSGEGARLASIADVVDYIVAPPASERTASSF